jgi:hypothetical protein
VTKTKASHYRRAAQAPAPAAPTWPRTSDGAQLANEVRANPSAPEEVKGQLIRRILEHEASHGCCTQTFLKKIRKQLRSHAG